MKKPEEKTGVPLRIDGSTGEPAIHIWIDQQTLEIHQIMRDYGTDKDGKNILAFSENAEKNGLSLTRIVITGNEVRSVPPKERR